MLGLCSQLLAVYPDLTILSVTPDLASAFTQQLCCEPPGFRHRATARHCPVASCSSATFV